MEETKNARDTIMNYFDGMVVKFLLVSFINMQKKVYYTNLY